MLDLLEPAVQSLGFVLHGVEKFSYGRKRMLRVYIDCERGVNLDDCMAVHAPLAHVMSEHGMDYDLEVSSPGLDRPLFTPSQLAAAVGADVAIRTIHKLHGRRNFTGLLQSVDEDGDAVLEIDNQQHAIAVSDIERAKLVLPENL